jgi:hypothetical protein
VSCLEREFDAWERRDGAVLCALCRTQQQLRVLLGLVFDQNRYHFDASRLRIPTDVGCDGCADAAIGMEASEGARNRHRR